MKIMKDFTEIKTVLYKAAAAFLQFVTLAANVDLAPFDQIE